MAHETISSRPGKAGLGAAAAALIAVFLSLPGVAPTSASLAQPAQEPAYYLRHPTGHGSTLVFEHDERIWKQVGDGPAERVTDLDIRETAPVLSPNGGLVAFVAFTDTSDEVFVASLASGRAHRLTFNGGFDAKVQGWLSATEMLYSTTGASGKRGPLLFGVDVATGRTRAIPLVEAAEGCVLGDAFVYVKNQELVDSNRLYEGGYAQRIMKIDAALAFGAQGPELAGKTPSVLLTADYEGISRNPLCIGERIFFLSDRDGRFNIWSMTSDGGDLLQHTVETDHDIRSMTTSDGTSIYYQRAGELFRLDPQGGPAEEVVVRIPAAAGAETERFVLDAADATEFVVSDDGTRVALIVRGKLWAVDLPSGAAKCLECASDRRVRSLSMPSDSGTVFALHDASGEYDIYAYDMGTGGVRRIDHDIEVPIFDVSASPDGLDLLVRAIPRDVYHVDVRSGATTPITLETRTRPEGIAWSPDSRFAVFVTFTEAGMGRVTTYNMRCASVTYLTSGRQHVYAPVFSQDVREIYFIARTNFRSSIDDTWEPASYWPSYDETSLVHAVDLSALWAPEHDAAPTGRVAAAPPGARPDPCPPPVTQRGASRHDRLLVRELPFTAGNYDDLWVGGGRLYALSMRAPRDEWGRVVVFPRYLEAGRSTPRIVFDEPILDHAISATGRALMALSAGGLFLSSLADDGDLGPVIPLRTVTGLEVEIDLAAEREQIFEDLWRMHRDRFWDADMAGVDWEGERDKYRAFLPRVSGRAAFDEVVAAMVSELGAGHTSLGAPPTDLRARQGVARLGADLAEEEGGLRVVDILDGDLDVVEERSPLSATIPPVDVGDRITHVNGIVVRSRRELDRMLYERVGQTVILRVEKPDGRIYANDVRAIGAGHETWLRQRAWAADNAALVEELSGGRVGYVHLQSSYEADFSGFVRQYLHLHRREALILDLRGNNGGNIDPWLLHFLQRRTWLYIADRYDAMALKHPQASFDGELIVLIDGDTYSDGELIAEGIRHLGLGTLVGTRTSGAGKWVNDERTLVDGSRVRLPEAGSYFFENGQPRWIIEGRGVEPDIHVENDPFAFYHGFDAQLQAAVDAALAAREESAGVDAPPVRMDDRGASD